MKAGPSNLLPALAAALSLAACSGAVAPPVVDDGTVIADVTLVSPERQAPLPHADVVIRNGRIAQIGTGLVVGPQPRRIDRRGRFLIPGLIDSANLLLLGADPLSTIAAYDTIDTIFLSGAPIARRSLMPAN
jgi:hypothetical protein